MEKNRCTWAENDPLMSEYHDNEWGIPLYDDHRIFEFLLLETFQAGLSWRTILNKRENFRKAFDNFYFNKIAAYNDKKAEKLLQDAGIIRNKMKIMATIANAQAYQKVRKEFGTFSKYIWDFVDGKPIVNQFGTLDELPAKTALSDRISADLKKRGFKFVGSTVVYAHMQATGMVNDHFTYCFRWKEVQGK